LAESHLIVEYKKLIDKKIHGGLIAIHIGGATTYGKKVKWIKALSEPAKSVYSNLLDLIHAALKIII